MFIVKLVNEGLYHDGGRIRQVPVTIDGSSYRPPLPIENIVKKRIDKIVDSNLDSIDIAIELTSYVMKIKNYNQ